MPIAFLTFFLTLARGPQPVALAVQPGVATVELRLDGEVAARLAGPPWTATVDLGRALLPHRLEARGLAADGSEVGRIEQWVNMPRPPAEVEIVLAEGGAGTREARLHWASRTDEKPTEIRLSLDGAPLPLDGQSRAVLPAQASPSSTTSAHVLSAELRFANGVTARKDVALGGEWSGEAATELTAVPVEADAARELAKEDVRGLFTAGGRPLPVAAVDREAPQVFLVRAPGIEADVRAMLPSLNRSLVGWDRRRDGREVVFHLVAAAPRMLRAKDLTTEIFDLTPEHALAGKKLGDLLLGGRFRPEVLEPSRLADATAVAGLNAQSRNTPRAVLLVLRGGETGDASHLDPTAVRAYLDTLGVPLFVWSLTGRGSPAWGEVEDVSTALRLHTAYERFARELERQRIVWLEGRWLPQEIALSPAATARGIARVSTAAPPR